MRGNSNAERLVQGGSGGQIIFLVRVSGWPTPGTVPSEIPGSFLSFSPARLITLNYRNFLEMKNKWRRRSACSSEWKEMKANQWLIFSRTSGQFPGLFPIFSRWDKKNSLLTPGFPEIPGEWPP